VGVDTDVGPDGFDAVRLHSRDALEASFAPQVGWTCRSLRHRGDELLGERFGLAAFAGCGITMGMSLMHPWAGRLSSWSYSACGTGVRLPISPLLHTDGSGLPVNGVQSPADAWVLQDCRAADRSAWFDATLPFDANARGFELFPFPHRLRLHVELAGRSLSIRVELEATGAIPVPVCFGYRLFLRRGDGSLVLPARRRLMTDERLFPTGGTEPLGLSAHPPGADELDEVALLGTDRRLALASHRRRVALESTAGFPFAHVRSVAREPHVMLEALTAAPDALSRNAFPLAIPGVPYRAALRLSVDDRFGGRRDPA
jgi:galactose mutarotase-like enzyme